MKTRCSKCRAMHTRKNQRYCAKCHADYMRVWRAEHRRQIEAIRRAVESDPTSRMREALLFLGMNKKVSRETISKRHRNKRAQDESNKPVSRTGARR